MFLADISYPMLLCAGILNLASYTRTGWSVKSSSSLEDEDVTSEPADDEVTSCVSELTSDSISEVWFELVLKLLSMSSLRLLTMRLAYSLANAI